MSTDPPAQPTLTTERLRLRPFRGGDAPRVRTLAGAREVAENTLTIPHPYPEGAAEEWIATHPVKWAEGTLVAFAMEHPEDGVIGAIGLVITREHRRGELGYWVGIPWWNQGYATEAVRAILAYGFDGLELNRIWARHFTRNPASGRVMEKAGMRFEGILRGHMIKWGKSEDLAVYGAMG